MQIERSPVDPSPIERHFSGRIEACDSAWALARIRWFFLEKEARFWNSSLRIDGVAAVREVAFRPWGYGKIPRRYCTAQAFLSDGTTRKIHYSIIEKGGFTGVGTGVEFCVQGFDRERSYAPDCKMARP